MSCAPTVERNPMAKSKPRNDEAVRLASDVVRQARVVAAIRGVSIGQYLSETLRPIVANDSRDATETFAAEVKPAKKSPKR